MQSPERANRAAARCALENTEADASGSPRYARSAWLVRSVQRAVLGRWLKRLHVADAIVSLASVEADLLLTIWEFIRCALSHYSLRC